MNHEKICIGVCDECGRVIKATEDLSRVGGKEYHSYCWITQNTVANA